MQIYNFCFPGHQCLGGKRIHFNFEFSRYSFVCRLHDLQNERLHFVKHDWRTNNEISLSNPLLHVSLPPSVKGDTHRLLGRYEKRINCWLPLIHLIFTPPLLIQRLYPFQNFLLDTPLFLSEEFWFCPVDSFLASSDTIIYLGIGISRENPP